MENPPETEVLIAGAGPVGLALALELQRFGIRFRIVEKMSMNLVRNWQLAIP